MPNPESKEEHRAWLKGYLMATADVARRGHDVIAEELMASAGIHKPHELNHRGLQDFDKKPLRQILNRRNGRA